MSQRCRGKKKNPKSSQVCKITFSITFTSAHPSITLALPDQFTRRICIQNALQTQIKTFQRHNSHLKAPAVQLRVTFQSLFINSWLRGPSSGIPCCSTDTFHSTDIFRTCCREQKISVSGAQEPSRQKWKRSVPPRDHWHLIFLSSSPELGPNTLCPTTWRSSQLK